MSFLQSQRSAQTLISSTYYSPHTKTFLTNEVNYLVSIYTSLSPQSTRISTFHPADSGSLKDALTLMGTIPVPFQGHTFNIPVRITFLEGYPSRPPVAHVIPTADMVIRPSEYVREDGTVQCMVIQRWNPSCNCDVLIKDMIAAFTYKMPVFSKPAGNKQAPPQSNGQPKVTPPVQQKKEPQSRPSTTALERSLMEKFRLEVEKAKRDRDELEQEKRDLQASREEAISAKSFLTDQIVVFTQSKRTKLLSETQNSKEALQLWLQQNPSSDVRSVTLDQMLPVSNRFSHQLLGSLAKDCALEETANAVIEQHYARRCSTEDLIRSLKHLYRLQFIEWKRRDKAAAAIQQIIGL